MEPVRIYEGFLERVIKAETAEFQLQLQLENKFCYKAIKTTLCSG